MINSEITDRKIGVLSFFAGAGFLDLGFETTHGFETIFVNEYHKPFMEIYKASRKGLNIKQPAYGYNTDDICAFLESKKATSLKL